MQECDALSPVLILKNPSPILFLFWHSVMFVVSMPHFNFSRWLITINSQVFRPAYAVCEQPVPLQRDTPSCSVCPLSSPLHCVVSLPVGGL